MGEQEVNYKGVYQAMMVMAAIAAYDYRGYADMSGPSHPSPNLKKSTLKRYATVPDEKYKGTGRNEQCPCGSGKKYKKCCLQEKK